MLKATLKPKSSCGLPVVLRVGRHGSSSATVVRSADQQTTWSRGAAWIVAVPMVCLATGLGWRLVDRPSGGAPAAVAEVPSSPTPEDVPSAPAQLPPVMAQTNVVPTPPPRGVVESPGDIVQAGFASGEPGYHVNKEVAAVQPPPAAEDESDATMPTMRPVPKGDVDLKPTAAANRASAQPRKSRINGIIRIDERD